MAPVFIISFTLWAGSEGLKTTALPRYILTLVSTKRQNFGLIKIEAFEKFVSGRTENIVGKGENCGYQNFLLFPKCFQKASFSRLL